VKNAGAASQTLIIEAVNFADPLPDDNLARALNIHDFPSKRKRLYLQRYSREFF